MKYGDDLTKKARMTALRIAAGKTVDNVQSVGALKDLRSKVYKALKMAKPKLPKIKM